MPGGKGTVFRLTVADISVSQAADQEIVRTTVTVEIANTHDFPVRR